MSKDQQEQLVLQQIAIWDGAITTKIGYALRAKTYDCFNKLIGKLGSELSAAINNKIIKDDHERLQLIKTILAKHNLYTH